MASSAARPSCRCFCWPRCTNQRVHELANVGGEAVVVVLVFGEVPVLAGVGVVAVVGVDVVVVVGAEVVVLVLSSLATCSVRVLDCVHEVVVVGGEAVVQVHLLAKVHASARPRARRRRRRGGRGDACIWGGACARGRRRCRCRWRRRGRAGVGQGTCGCVRGRTCLQDVCGSSAVFNDIDGAPRCSALNHHGGYWSSLCAA